MENSSSNSDETSCFIFTLLTSVTLSFNFYQVGKMIWINNLSIKKKLVSGFLLSSLIVLIVGGVGFIGASRNVSNLKVMNQVALKEYMAFEKWQTLVLQHRRYEKNFFLNIGNREKQLKNLELFKKISEETFDLMKKIDAIRAVYMKLSL